MELTQDSTTWRVLIVDDEPDNLGLVSDVLEFSGAQSLTARDGTSGLELVDTFKPNIILLDLGMPHLDGWEVHRRLRARADLVNVPIVALTAMAMPDDVARVHAAGFDAYIAKPFRVKGLLDDLRACIQATGDKVARAGAAEQKH
jgi:DNA-binding response OmpR family regulator